MLPVWDDGFSISNIRVDEQHKHLFELCARVERALNRHISKAEIKELLTEIFDYMKYHFNDEEKYMKLIGYPGLEEHRKIHKEMIQTMIQIIQNVKTINDLKEKLYDVAKKWLLEHILYEDMKIADWRRSMLTIDDDFTEEYLEDNHKKVIYLYVCDCKGKMHDVPYKIHQEIQQGKGNFVCKQCKQNIKFHKEYI